MITMEWIQNSGMRRWQDYLTLCKPKVVLVMLVTAWVGMLLAANLAPDPWVILWASAGIGCLASSAAAINHVIDRRIDARMKRTHNRPLPQGKVSPQEALVFALLLALFGSVILIVGVNMLTFYLTASALVGYAVVYTAFLKRATPQNIVIGGLAGALPPLLGWTAITNEIQVEAILLVMIVFVWTPPHFWALCVARREDYRKAGVPMLPVTHGVAFTVDQIVLYSMLLVPVTLLPYLLGMSGVVYLIAAIPLSIRFLQLALRMKTVDPDLYAMKTFLFSIQFILAIYLALLIDKGVQSIL